MTKYSSTEFPASDANRNPNINSTELVREKQFLRNTRLINHQESSFQMGKNLVSSDNLHNNTSSCELKDQRVFGVENGRRKRPTTAPRNRTEPQSYNLASGSKLKVTLENASQQPGKGSSHQKHKIKTYLKKEINLNRFVSVNDYKNMTKQVKDLRNLESAYLSESLTANQLSRTVSQLYGSSFTSSASKTQLRNRLQSFQKKPRG